MVEIRVMRNHYKTILAELKVEFKSIHTHIKGMLHSLYGILRHKARTSSMSLNINIFRHIHIINPALSERILDRYSHMLRILAWSRRKVMIVDLRTLV